MDNRRPPQLSGPYRTEVAAVVKWYNRTKGFGFVKPDDGAPDAFLHASLVAQAGHEDLVDGTSLVCDIADGPRGPQVAAIHSIEPPTEPCCARGRRGFGGDGEGELVEGGSSSTMPRRASASSCRTTAARTCSCRRAR